MDLPGASRGVSRPYSRICAAVNNGVVNERELAVRREIFEAFAARGVPPSGLDPAVLAALAAKHVVVLDAGGRIVMAHPFAAPPGGCTVEAGGRVWWGNCAWDGFGIAAALGLREAVVESGGVRAEGRAVLHVAVPARAWWDDIAFT
jgi:hypothetical protein